MEIDKYTAPVAGSSGLSLEFPFDWNAKVASLSGGG